MNCFSRFRGEYLLPALDRTPRRNPLTRNLRLRPHRDLSQKKEEPMSFGCYQKRRLTSMPFGQRHSMCSHPRRPNQGSNDIGRTLCFRIMQTHCLIGKSICGSRRFTSLTGFDHLGVCYQITACRDQQGDQIPMRPLSEAKDGQEVSQTHENRPLLEGTDGFLSMS